VVAVIGDELKALTNQLKAAQQENKDLRVALTEAMDLIRYEPTWLSDEERAIAARLRQRWSL
jgi:hypothetical protein